MYLQRKWATNRSVYFYGTISTKYTFHTFLPQLILSRTPEKFSAICSLIKTNFRLQSSIFKTNPIIASGNLQGFVLVLNFHYFNIHNFFYFNLLIFFIRFCLYYQAKNEAQGCKIVNLIFIHFYTFSLFIHYCTNGNEWKWCFVFSAHCSAKIKKKILFDVPLIKPCILNSYV